MTTLLDPVIVTELGPWQRSFIIRTLLAQGKKLQCCDNYRATAIMHVKLFEKVSKSTCKISNLGVLFFATSNELPRAMHEIYIQYS